jgi:AbrB family looped-hinge helix DNA binding protein
MEWVQVRRKYQITLPKSVRQNLQLNEGDLLAVEVRDDELVLRPQAVIDRDQSWYWSPKWQAAEREADQDLQAGRYDEFDSMEEMIADLEQQIADHRGR